MTAKTLRAMPVIFGLVSACPILVADVAMASSEWEQTHKLTADDGAPLDCFGNTAIDGIIAIVGAMGHDSFSGKVYVFDAMSGEQIRTLVAADTEYGDWFGGSLAICGDTAIIGGDMNPDWCGAAYLFDVTTGEQLGKLTAEDAAPFAYFGTAVAIRDDVVVVGAYGDAHAGYRSGAAYLFDVTTGQQLHKLMADDAAPQDWFGKAVAVAGDIALVGASADDDAGDGSGSVYVFDVLTGQQLRKLIAEDAAAFDCFGDWVAISDNVAIIGAPGDGDGTGAAYLFNVVTGQQLHKLTADDGAAEDGFGGCVAISGQIAIVGAPNYDDAGNESGSAYLFDITTGQQLQKLNADDADAQEYFGASASISGHLAIVGAPWDDDNGQLAGAAYIFEKEQCPADFDGDGDVDTADLLHLLGCWGTGCGDIDGDGDTDTADLLALLAAWGECGG